MKKLMKLMIFVKIVKVQNYEGTMCCGDCGMMNSKHIVETAGWRYYGAQDTKSSNPIRRGMIVNEFLPKSSLSSVIKNSVGSKRWYNMNKMVEYHRMECNAIQRTQFI